MIKKITIVTDFWLPQVNGVVRALSSLNNKLLDLGFAVQIIHPFLFKNFAWPTYPEIKVAIPNAKKFKAMVEDFSPDAIHIAGEFSMGLMARAYCRKHNYRFSTSFHTKYPEYFKAYLHIPIGWTYRYLRWFHRAAVHTMVSTKGLQAELTEKNFQKLVIWRRGADIELFHPDPIKTFINLARPIYLYVGRIVVEKNIEAFLNLTLPGSKVVVGEGPKLADYQRKYPGVNFIGVKHGDELASIYASADVFVFPSKTDTLGLVNIEALASGTPIAAYPGRGPMDIIGDAPVGCFNNDLAVACEQALLLDRKACREFALHYSWEASAKEFISHLVKLT
jgi:glycosyltransferase involved in cell wall biosynthesis